jgi:hypothetical protein
MKRLLAIFAAICFFPTIVTGQTPDQSSVGEKHFGAVCAKLTADSECKVCGLDSSHHWACYSHALWKEIPGNATPLPPTAPSATKNVGGGGEASAGSGTDLGSCWSSSFDEITDPYLKTNLIRDQDFMRGKLEQAVEQAGGTDQFLLQFEQQKAAFEDAQAQGQDEVEFLGAPHPISQLMLLADGSIEVAKCLDGRGPGSDVASSSPPRASETNVWKKQDCGALLAYRDTELQHDFQAAVTRHDLHVTEREENFTLAKQTLQLMDNGWWGGRLTGGHGKALAEVAINVKFVTDEVNGFLALFNPAESVTLDTVNSVGREVDVVRSAVDNGAKQASADGGKAAAWMLAEEIGKLNKESTALQALGGGAAMVHGAVDYQENMEKMEDAETTIQQEVGKLVTSARNWQDKAAEAKAESDAINRIRQQISGYCSMPSQQQGIPIGQPADQGIPIRPPD